MERSSLAILFVMITVILAVLLMQIVTNNVQNTKRIGSQLILGIFMNVTYLMSLFIGDVRILEILHAVVMILESWICYLFLLYTYERIHSWQVKLQANAKVSVVLILIENALLLINAFTGLFFEYSAVEIGNSTYIVTGWTWLSVLHLVGCGFIMAMVVVVMVRKAQMVARVYRIRYLLSSVVFAIGTILIVGGRLLTGNMNIFTVVFVSMGIMCTYYIYFQYPLLRAVFLLRPHCLGRSHRGSAGICFPPRSARPEFPAFSPAAMSCRFMIWWTTFRKKRNEQALVL